MLAIIGGTGVELNSHRALSNLRDEVVETRWGRALITRVALGEKEVLFLHRHANPETKQRHVPPHAINYRANIAALRMLGATAILASSAVGSLRSQWKPGTLVLLDQFIDCTTARAKTFFGDRAVHIDVTEPYCLQLQRLLRRAAMRLYLPLRDSGTYLCTDGPRFETPAEIRMFRGWGADLVGMTGVPEVVLAREAEIAYAGVSIVTNLAAGIASQPLTQSEVVDEMKQAMPKVVDLFLEAAQEYSPDDSWPSRRATREFVTADFDPRSCIL